MGLLRAEGAVYKPVEQIDLGPTSDEVYVKANVKGACFLAHFFYLFHNSSGFLRLIVSCPQLTLFSLQLLEWPGFW